MTDMQLVLDPQQAEQLANKQLITNHTVGALAFVERHPAIPVFVVDGVCNLDTFLPELGIETGLLEPAFHTAMRRVAELLESFFFGCTDEPVFDKNSKVFAQQINLLRRKGYHAENDYKLLPDEGLEVFIFRIMLTDVTLVLNVYHEVTHAG